MKKKGGVGQTCQCPVKAIKSRFVMSEEEEEVKVIK